MFFGDDRGMAEPAARGRRRSSSRASPDRGRSRPRRSFRRRRTRAIMSTCSACGVADERAQAQRDDRRRAAICGVTAIVIPSVLTIAGSLFRTTRRGAGEHGHLALRGERRHHLFAVARLPQPRPVERRGLLRRSARPRRRAPRSAPGAARDPETASRYAPTRSSRSGKSVTWTSPALRSTLNVPRLDSRV